MYETATIASMEGVWVYRNGRAVLEDVDLEIKEKDFLGLIGPNGGGKSTLLKVFLGLIKPDRGSVEVFGLPPKEARRYMGYMPQRTLFDQNFPVTAREVVLMGRFNKAGLFRRYKSEDLEAASKALSSVDMEDQAEREIGFLSGGEQQRVFVARALVSEPKLLLLDEPEAGIDAAQRCEFYELLCRLNQTISIVMVSHDISAVSSHVNKVACLNHRLYYHGTKELRKEDLETAYHCPVDMIAHGVPHRVLREHD